MIMELILYSFEKEGSSVCRSFDITPALSRDIRLEASIRSCGFISSFIYSF